MGKRNYSWTGGGQVIVPEPDSSTSVSELIELVPALQANEEGGRPSNCLIEAIYLHFSIQRILVSTFDALGFIVYVDNVAEGGNTPTQALDALSTNARSYGNKGILMMAPLPVPPVLGAGDLATFTTSEEIKTSSHEYKATRKLDRQGQVLCMAVNTDLTATARVFCQWRVLLSYGQR